MGQDALCDQQNDVNDDIMVNFNQYLEEKERQYMIEGTLINTVREARMYVIRIFGAREAR
jgi:hypothetical protein